jgi:hypothetical protein
MNRWLWVAPLLLNLLGTCSFADDWQTITPDVVYGHKAGMALTYDVVKPAKPNGAAVLFMVSGGWVSTWARPDSVVRGDKPDSLNLFEKIVDRGYRLNSPTARRSTITLNRRLNQQTVKGTGRFTPAARLIGRLFASRCLSCIA